MYHFSRHSFYTFAALIISGLILSMCVQKRNNSSVEEDGKKPNILIVMADQWRAQSFGHRDNPDVITPNIDKLASEGVVFKNAVSGMPVCTPARAVIMTGQRPLTNGIFMNDVQLDTNAISLGKVMAENGYQTGYVGKWHLNDHGRSAFIPKGNSRQAFKYWNVDECTHDYNHSVYYTDTPDTLLWEGYDAIAQTRNVCNYIRAYDKTDKPFFMILSWGPPHEPYHTAPKKYRELYSPEKMWTRPNVPAEIKEKVQYDLSGYYAHCTALDDMMGLLRQTLKETGIDNNTIILFLSDHGDLLGSHHYYKKQQPYDESIRIPMIWYVPEKLGGKQREVDAMIGVEDVMPTILGFCGVSIPRNVDGIDYSNYIRGGDNPGDTVALISCVQPFGQWDRKNGGKEYRGIRSPHYTYVRDLSGPWLFFDNENDPYQMNNLIGKKKYEGLAGSFDHLLSKKLAETEDEFLPGSFYLRKWNYPELDENETVPYTH